MFHLVFVINKSFVKFIDYNYLNFIINKINSIFKDQENKHSYLTKNIQFILNIIEEYNNSKIITTSSTNNSNIIYYYR